MLRDVVAVERFLVFEFVVVLGASAVDDVVDVELVVVL